MLSQLIPVTAPVWQHWWRNVPQKTWFPEPWADFPSCYIYDRVSGSCPDLHSAAFDKDSVTQQLLKQPLHLFIQQAKGSHLCHYSESRYKDAPAEVIPVSNSFIFTLTCVQFISPCIVEHPQSKGTTQSSDRHLIWGHVSNLRETIQQNASKPNIYLFISKLVVQHSSSHSFQIKNHLEQHTLIHIHVLKNNGEVLILVTSQHDGCSHGPETGSCISQCLNL